MYTEISHQVLRSHSSTVTQRESLELLAFERTNSLRNSSRGEDGFLSIYQNYHHRVYCFALSRLGNRADSEDAVQETFAAVFESLDSFEEKATLLAWIYGIARNVINNQVRRAQAEELRVSKAEAGFARSVTSLDLCTPEHALGLRRCTAAMETRLGEVSDWQAEAFQMRHLDGLPVGEIARRVERSQSAVRCGLYRVKRLILDALHQDEASLH